MFNLTKFIEALNNMGVKVLIPIDFSVWLFKGKYDITLEKQEIDKLMKELGTDNAIQIIGLLAIAKRWIRRNKRKKTDIENSNIVKKLTCVPEKEKYNGS